MDRRQIARATLRCLSAVLVLALAMAALHFSLRSLDWPSFKAQLHQLDWRWLALAVVFDVAGYCAQGWRWQILLTGSTLMQTTRAIYAGLFLNELIPLRPGEAVRGWMVSKELNVSLWNVVAPTMLSERIMDGFWLTLAMVTVMAVAPLTAGVRHVIWFTAAVVAIAVVVSVCLGGRSEFLTTLRAGILQRRAVLVSSLALIGQALAFWATARASHLPLGIAAASVVMIVVRIGTMLPGAPANLGTHQLSTVLGLSLFGIAQRQAAGFSVIVFTVLTMPLIVLGFWACLSAGLTRNWVHQVSAPRVLSQPTGE